MSEDRGPIHTRPWLLLLAGLGSSLTGVVLLYGFEAKKSPALTLLDIAHFATFGVGVTLLLAAAVASNGKTVEERDVAFRTTIVAVPLYFGLLEVLNYLNVPFSALVALLLTGPIIVGLRNLVAWLRSQ